MIYNFNIYMNFEKFKQNKDYKNKNATYLKLDEYLWNENINSNMIESSFLNLHKPFVVRNFCKDTIAVKYWNKDNINHIFDNAKFPSEIYETDDDFYSGQKKDGEYKTTLSNFIGYVYSNLKPYIYIAEVDLNEIKCDHAKIVEHIYNYNINPNVQNSLISHNMFFGHNASSNCHIHVEDNYILNQIFGEKTIFLFDYHDNNNTWSSDWLLGSIVGDDVITQCNPFSYTPNFIKNDFFSMDHSNMTVYKVTLKPGDSLFIPPHWWHATQGHQLNLSITSIYKRSDLSYLFFKPLLILIFLLKVLKYELNYTISFKTFRYYLFLFSFFFLFFFFFFSFIF